MKEFFSSFFSSANIIARAKALIINAFALTGRFVFINPYTQGVALGYVLIGLSARHCTYIISFTSLHIRCWYRVLANVIGFTSLLIRKHVPLIIFNIIQFQKLPVFILE